MNPNGKRLLEGVSSEVRLELARERARAMAGSLDGALRRLSQLTAAVGRGSRFRDAVAVAMLRAELLDLDGRQDESLEWFNQQVLPLKDRLELHEQFVVEQNQADLECRALTTGATRTFYNLVDRRRAVGFEWLDAQDLLEAQEAARNGKHYDALPALWRLMVTSYLQGCWLSVRLATRAWAEEVLQLGNLVDAAHHAVMALDSNRVDAVAKAILARQDAGVTHEVVAHLIKYAHIQAHSTLARKLLMRIADLIPDEDLDVVSRWLLARGAYSPHREKQAATTVEAWEAIEAIGHRLPSDFASHAVREAVKHPVWTATIPGPNVAILERKPLLEAVGMLLESVEVGSLGQFTADLLPLAQERRQDLDYRQAIDVLCRLGKRGGEELKRQIADALIPVGQPVDRVLVLALPHLRPVSTLQPQSLVQLCDQVVAEIRAQVQDVRQGEEIPPVLGQLLVSQRMEGCDQRVARLVVSDAPNSLIGFRAVLPDDSLEKLVRAMLDMIGERDNFIGNRIALAQCLIQFADRVSATLRHDIHRALLPLARGGILESRLQPPQAESENPLNPFQFRIGTVEELQHVSLFALAEFSQLDKELADEFAEVLEEAFYHDHPTVRSGAFGAVAKLKVIAEPVLLALLLATRDPEPGVATAAFYSMAKQPDWVLTRPQWRLLLQSIRLALRSPTASVRREAAYAAARRLGRPKLQGMRTQLQAMVDQFATDPCASVREGAHSREVD